MWESRSLRKPLRRLMICRKLMMVRRQKSFQTGRNSRRVTSINKIQEEKDRRKIINREPIKKLLKKKLEENSLQKAAGECVECINRIMETFYRDKFRKLIQICRSDQTMLNDMLSANRQGVPITDSLNGITKNVQLVTTTMVGGVPNVNKLHEIDLIYSNDSKHKLMKLDQEHSKIIDIKNK
mmetsp:Transcript_37165/g.42688  ORF Transcript_37165/g.42688 Transcript_37165/m.42688 type:complete len:182 (-) Transcript_37165:78-623(-)